MMQDEEWLEVLRADRPASADLAHSTLARIFSAHDRRAALRRTARITAGGLAGVLACLAVAQQLSRPAAHVAPTERARDLIIPGTQRPVTGMAPGEGLSGGVALDAQPALEATGTLHVENEAPKAAVHDVTAAPATPRMRRTTLKQAARADQAVKQDKDAPEQVAASLSASAAPALSDSALRALYETAHRLQFAGDPEAALRAWDAFLTTQASGPLAVEARYYRALSLLRLGQREAAGAALLPFARGEYGDFRRHDAARWLERLDAAVPLQ